MSSLDDMRDYRARKERLHSQMFKAPSLGNIGKGLASLVTPSWFPTNALTAAGTAAAPTIASVALATPVGDKSLQGALQDVGKATVKGAAARFAGKGDSRKAKQVESAATR